MEFYCTCPTGFEPLLARELEAMRVPRVRPLKGMVSFEGTLRDAYTACLNTRLASRVVAVLARGGAATTDELYETACSVAWHEHLRGGASFAVDASGTNAELRNSQFVARRVKDAVTDVVLAHTGTRPLPNPKAPDLTLVARITRNRVSLGVDLVGAPLFRRGHERSAGGPALRADYAAALLMLSGWPTMAAVSDDATPTLVDASPTSSALLVEAAGIAAHRAPGLLRLKWGFTGWAQHDRAVWDAAYREAQDAAQDSPAVHLVVPSGTKGTASVRSALRAAGISAMVDAQESARLAHIGRPSAVVCDLSALSGDDLTREADALQGLMRVLRTVGACPCAAIARDELFSAFVGTEPSRRIVSKLGREDVFLSTYDTGEGTPRMPEVALGQDTAVPVLVPASDQFAARLRKVARQRAKWARHSDVTCYRVYDADLPDYAVAIDLYQGSDPTTGELDGRRWLHIAEYAPPKSVDATLARSRLVDVLSLAPAILDVDPRNTYLQIRQHAKGGSQYREEAERGQRAHRGQRPSRHGQGAPTLVSGAHLIDEGGLIFEVNFTLRHDCGIFLDHRETRALIREMAKATKGSKRFLNLFAYTGTATCYAADGGAKHTTTVDLSRPSLDWARRNMERNGFGGREHEYVQADVLAWVSEQRHTYNRWDLIFCDVPTFSNSHRMRKRSFDVQRDHAELLIGVSRLLTRDGICVFSCNLRKFSPDREKLEKAGVTLEDITNETIPEDFARHTGIHHTYIVRRDA